MAIVFRIPGFCLCGFLFFAPTLVSAQYNLTPESYVNPAIFLIDESKVLGAKADGALELIDGEGGAFTLADMLGKPLLIVLSYFTCDGSCSVINTKAAELLSHVKRQKLGDDFHVLTMSFDSNDTLETLNAFRRHLQAEIQIDEKWTFALAKNHDGVKSLADRFGYKFFWSPRDKTFFHPDAFLFLSAEGRLVRVLYASSVEPEDVELAVLDARQGSFRPGEVFDYVINLCYSYNYKEGRYTLNIPLFAAMGSMLFGVAALSAAAFSIRFRKNKKGDVA